MSITSHLITLPRENHKHNGGDDDGNADDDMNCDDFAKGPRTDQHGGDGFEHAHDRGFGGTDAFGGGGQRGGGDDGGEHCQPNDVETGLRLGGELGNFGGQRSALLQHVRQKNHRPRNQHIESEQRIGHMRYSVIAIDDDDENGIDQCRRKSQHKALPRPRLRTFAVAQKQHANKRGGYRQPNLPCGIDAQKHHKQRHQNRVEKNDGGGNARRNVVVRLEQKQTTRRKEQSQQHQPFALRSIHTKIGVVARQHNAEQTRRQQVAKKEYRIDRNAVFDKRHSKQWVQPIGNARKHTRCIAQNDGFFAAHFANLKSATKLHKNCVASCTVWHYICTANLYGTGNFGILHLGSGGGRGCLARGQAFSAQKHRLQRASQRQLRWLSAVRLLRQGDKMTDFSIAQKV